MTDPVVASGDHALSFGAFRLVPSRQLLLEGEKLIRVGTRAFQILTILVDNAGEVVTKEDLIARVWPNTYVEEGSLRVHIAAIRKVLGDGRGGNRYIVNIPLRGYRFVAPVSISRTSEVTARPAVAVVPAYNLPVPLTRIVGRTEVINAIAAQLPRRRFVTIVGTGGIGKTTVALAVAEALSTLYRDGVLFIDLTPLSDGNLVPSAVASVLGIAIPADNPIPALVSFLRAKQILLIVDNCEHLVEATAALASELLKGVEGLHILATSREPLRAEGEYVHRLSGLNFPPVSAALTAAEALAFPAVELFVERAVANSDQFELSDENAPIVAEICRRLDGIALALELAAGRVDAFGIRDLAACFGDRFGLLTSGRRDAAPRHRTLWATLNWSYELLTEAEREALRRFSVFPAGFTLNAAKAVVTREELTSADMYDHIANLVTKSLLTADVSEAVARYRLLDTTRAFALQKLAECGELAAVARRHAVYYRDLLEEAGTLWATKPTSEWLEAYAPEIDNIRAALDWAFAAGGDASTGTALAIASTVLWIQLSLLEECRARAGQALAFLEGQSGPQTRQKMLLQAALAVSFLHTHGPVRQTAAAWTKVLKLAEELKDPEYQLRALYGLWVSSVDEGGYPAALASAHRFRTVAEAKADASGILVGDRLVGVSLHFLGDQTEARRHIERMLDRYDPAIHGAPAVRFGLDQRVGALTHLARILWLQGLPDQAMCTAQAGIAQARIGRHANSLCLVLADGAIPISILSGELAMAEQLVAELTEQAEKHALGLWYASGLGLRGWIGAQRGDGELATSLLRSALDNMWEGAVGVRYAMFLGWLAEALGSAGRTDEGISAIDEALHRSERNEEHWCVPELLRIRGELMLLQKQANVTAAEDSFLQALNLARRQGALSWELRCAISLAQLRRKQGREEEAHMLLAAVSNCFTEGFATADFAKARLLLDVRSGQR